MVLPSPVTTMMVRSTDKVPTTGRTDLVTKACGLTTASKERGRTHGRTVEFTEGSGNPTACTGRECTPGLTADATKASTRTTKNTDKGSIVGPMAKHTTVPGGTASSMETALSTIHRPVRLKTALGRMESAWVIGRRADLPLPRLLGETDGTL